MTNFKSTVDSLFTRYAKPCTIVKTESGGYDPSTGTTTTVEHRYTARAIETGYELRDIADTLIEAGDRVGYFQITDPSFTGAVGLDMAIEFPGDAARPFKSVQIVAPSADVLYHQFVA